MQSAKRMGRRSFFHLSLGLICSASGAGCQISKNNPTDVEGRRFDVKPFGELITTTLPDGTISLKIPPFSGHVEVPLKIMADETKHPNLGEVASFLEERLTDAGYDNLGFYSIEKGFALATPLEEVSSSAEPVNHPSRWEISNKLSGPFTPEQYFRHLFKGPGGFYRMFLFVLTDENIPNQNAYLDLNALEPWKRGGVLRANFPNLNMFVSKGHHCFVLAYFFEIAVRPSRNGDEKAGRQINAPVSVNTQLKMSGIWYRLAT